MRLPLFPLFGGLQSEMQPIYVDDMTEYLIRALRSDIQGEYLISGRDKINLNEFLKKSLAFKKKRRVFLKVPSFITHIALGTARFNNIYHSRTYSIEKTITDFQYTPRPLEAGLRAWLE